ncbi:MAG: hypothetical protein IT292_07980 [Deltaproteobacteria bacterium]|nr:hypothetical protein [Deltaproteobacteria bacterium]
MLIGFQLSIQANALPLTTAHLVWADNSASSITNTGIVSVDFDKINNKYWFADWYNNRLLSAKTIDLINGKVLVDKVVGQISKSGHLCNKRQEDSWIAYSPTDASSLCNPNVARFDRKGNLYVIENHYECHGNNRITVFMAEDLKKMETVTTMFPNIGAKKVFNKASLTQSAMSKCSDRVNNPNSPVSLAFDSLNQMIVGNDGYSSSNLQERPYKQLFFYKDPLKKNADGSFLQDQMPDAVIPLPLGASGQVSFDSTAKGRPYAY